jgi:hypothetical protein
MLGAAEWLSLAAAPTFAIMAIVSVCLGGSPPMLCATGADAFSLRGMAVMYLLMSAFHATPWLRLLARRRS